MAQSLQQTLNTNSLNLELYSQIKNLAETVYEPKQETSKTVYSIRISRNEKGIIERINYYTPEGILVKSGLYSGSELNKTKFFQKSYSYVNEDWDGFTLSGRKYYDSNDNLLYSVNYEYTKGKVTKISKVENGNEFTINYSYDEFGRVNKRIVIENGDVIAEHKYKYDVIDRITSYEDNSKKLCVWKMSAVNELLSYSVIDKNGNERIINNNFDEDGYKGSEISINNIKRTVCDPKFADNIVLKKPNATEDDLILVQSLYAKK